MKTKLVVLLFMAAEAAFGQLSVGVRIGAPPHVRVLRVQPRNPGPGYSWVNGYWYPVGNHYKWHGGYWTRPAYAGAHWVEPRHDGTHYFAGYWDGERGHVDHNHQWDRSRDHNRDFNRDHDHQ